MLRDPPDLAVNSNLVENAPSIAVLEAACLRRSGIALFIEGKSREGPEHGLNEAEKCGKEKHQEGGVRREKETHDRTFAKIRTHSIGQESLVCGQKRKAP